ncbi:MAG: glycosyltransferase family 2 protein [Clostridia bacterium]|nr:glycosyltransferase family 2 protein [Clostridia bacterium]
MVKVSIVVPICNVEKYLKECLDSILKQSLKDIEIICVDDGSKDSSLNILRDYEKKDKRIKVITKPNAGYGHTMNVGMDAALGEYIGIVESDDWVEKNMFKDLYNTAKKHDADIVKSDYYEFSTVAKREQVYIMTPLDEKYYNKVMSANDTESIYHFRMNTWTGIYKTSFLRKYGIKHNETPGASYQDNGFWFKTISLGQRIVFVDRAYYHYRQDNPNSSINNKSKVFCMCDEYAYIREFLDENPRLLKKHLGVFLAKKYFNYFYTYCRIAREHKKVFLERFSKEFNESYEKGEFDDTMLSKPNMDVLKRIMKDPERFYYEDTVWALKSKQTALSDEIGFYLEELERRHGKKH